MSKYHFNDTEDNNDYPDHVLEALEKIEDLKLEGKHKESIEMAEGLLCEDPDCVAALEEIADNYVSLESFKSAEKAALHALKLDKDSYIAHYILGFIHSHHQDWENALDELTVSNKIHPNNAEILRCLGWAMFNSKKRTQGIVILERSLSLDADNSLTLCDLGVCYLQTKDFEKSIHLLQKAMEIDPSNERVQECYRAAKNFSDRYSILTKNEPRKTTKKTPYRRSFI